MTGGGGDSALRKDLRGGERGESDAVKKKPDPSKEQKPELPNL